MQRIRVYDLPTRVFHWLFAGLFGSAFLVAQVIDDDSSWFSLHMLAGLCMGFLVMLRLLWSLVGTRHARLSDLNLAPSELLAYLKGVFSGRGRQWVGHNPASSWAAVAMIGLTLGLGLTGYLMATGGENGQLEDVHELMANAFLGIVLLHIAGIAVHVLRHRDQLQFAMLSGRKPRRSDDQQPVRPRPVAALGFAVFTGLFVGYLLQHYDLQARTLDLFGSTMQLGEREHEHGSDHAERERGRERQRHASTHRKRGDD
jgi:cytochrome b